MPIGGGIVSLPNWCVSKEKFGDGESHKFFSILIT